MENTWENSIMLPAKRREFTVLPAVIQFATQEHFIDIKTINLKNDIVEYIRKDDFPLPLKDDREGYCDERHYDYWLSGLHDFIKISDLADKHGLNLKSESRILDFGCASGRVLRHFALQSNSKAWGCDINEGHVIWCNKFLPKNVKVFQSSSLPQLQAEDNFFDLIFCLSVFTHIESFETSWLCELRRITKKDGLIYLTIHDESSWKNMPKEWGVGYAILNHPSFEGKWLEEGFPNEKFVSRYSSVLSYSSNVFYKIEYIKKTRDKFFEILEIIPMGAMYQTVIVLKKREE